MITIKFKAVFIAHLISAPLLFGQTQTLDLSEALKLGMANSHLQTIIDGHRELADGRVQALSTWDNPNLTLSTEEIDQAGLNSRETYLLISQRFERPGIRSLKIKASEQESAASEWRNQSRFLDFRTMIKALFYETLHDQKRLKVLTQWVEDARSIAGIIELRQQEGDVSGFDRRRLNAELAEARSQLARNRGSHQASMTQLKTVIGTEDIFELSGPLLPSLPEQKSGPSRHPDLLALDSEIKAAALEERAASLWALPEFSLEAGIKTTRIGGVTEDGYFLSAKVPIPAFNRGKPALARARAKSKIAQGEKALIQSNNQAKIRGLQAQIQQLRISRLEHQEQALHEARDLVGIARLAYREGEMALFALLDTLRTLRDSQLNGLALEMEARMRAIELEALRGGQ